MPFDRSLLTFDAARHRHLYDGQPLVGVTTALGIISKGDGLLQWAVNQAVEHITQQMRGEMTAEEVYVLLHEAKSAWKGKRDEAADIGTQAHNWIEHYLQGSILDYPENDSVRRSCEAAVRWLDTHRWTVLHTEKQIYSPRFGYAGIMDWCGLVDGELAIPDWKTSKGIYSTYRYQLAAYLKAYEEETGERIVNRWILRIDKTTGEFEDLCLPRKELAADFRAFRSALDLYKREQELKKRAYATRQT